MNTVDPVDRDDAGRIAWVARTGALAMLSFAAVGTMLNGVFASGLLAFPVVGVVIVWKRPRHLIGWLLLSIGATAQLGTVARIDSDVFIVAAAVRVVSKSAIVSSALIPFVVLLFPSGRLPSRRWRVPARVAAVALSVIVFTEIVRTESGEDNPLAVAALQPAVSVAFMVCGQLIIAFGVAALVNVIMRMRRSTGDEREQLRWFAASSAVFPALMIANALVMDTSWQGLVLTLAFTVGIASIALGIGSAVLKFHLYAIDIVINKAFVFGALAAVVTAIYVAVVAGVGAVVGARDNSNFALSLVATAAVAIAFQPLQTRLQAIANRLVYGQRLSPYEAVASFAHRVEESFVSEDVLPAMAMAAAMGIGAARSRVRLFHPGGGESVVWWPEVGTTEVDAAVVPSDAFDRIVPVMHQGEHLGDIAVARDRGDPMTPHHEQLLGDIVSQAVLAMRSLRLTEELRQRVVELRESRRRLVTAQDEERRRMERDLHDGAQQILVAMKIKLGLAKSMIDDEPDAASAMLDDVSEQSTEAINTLRDLARGLFPQALMDGGIVPAIQSHIAKSGLRASVEADLTVTRFDPETEANVYFVIREALQNASKYAPSASVVVHLGAADGALTFDITDDGVGFDAASVKLGNGTQNMRDRLEALGGELEIDSTPGHGTCVHGRAPVAHVSG